MYAHFNNDGTINPANEIVEENNYYPFGLKHEGYNNLPGDGYKYKFLNKEYEDSFALNVTETDFRHYDSALGRFNVVDPLAELAPNYTPYRYGFNNPVYFSDPSGLFETEQQAMEFANENGIKDYSLSFNRGYGGYVLTVIGGEFDGRTFYDFMELLPEALISVNGDGSGGSGSGGEGSNKVSWMWYSGYNIAKDSHTRLTYYFPKSEALYRGFTSPAEYAFGRYHLQQATRARLSTQGKAMSQILKTKEAQLATAKYYASKGIKPSGRLRGGESTARILRGAGTGIVVISAGMSVYNVATADNKVQALSGEVGGWTGAWAGAEAGAMICSFAGPWGTVIGGVVGGAFGYYYGAEAGTELYNNLSD